MDREKSLYQTAAGQHGVITRAQLLDLGLSERSVDRMIRRGELERIFKGVYRFTAAPDGFRQKVRAVTLWGGGRAAASHRAAVVLHRLSGVGSDVIEVTLEANSSPPAPWVLVHHSSDLPPEHLRKVEGIPVTTVARTLVDLGKVVPRSIVGRVLDDALRRRLVTLSEVSGVASALQRKGRRGPSVIRRLVAERDPTILITRSELEARFLRLIRRAGVPEPTPQFPIVVAGERLTLDFAFPRHRVAIECDGYEYHSGVGAWHRDLERRNLLAQAGWRVFHIAWRDVVRRERETATWLRDIFEPLASHAAPMAHRSIAGEAGP